MLEILYDTAIKEIRAWNSDMSVKGNLKPKEGQEVVIFAVDPPNFDSDFYYVDLVKEQVKGNPDYVSAMPFNPRAEIAELRAEIEKLKAK